MGVKIFIPPHTSKFDHNLSITAQGFGFSAKFIKDNNLEKNKFVQFGEDTENKFKFYVGFPEKNSESCFELQGHSKKNFNRTVKAGFFINSNDILKEIKNGSLTAQQRRFNLEYDKSNSMYFFQVIPNFESSCSPDNLEDVQCIYRYLNNDNIVIYIGIGNLKKRFKAPEKSSWISEVKTIEYSLVEDKNDREKFENISLKAYVSKYGQKPIYNKNLGKKF
jgi:hypothetical protein